MIEWTMIIKGKAEDLAEVPPGAEIEMVDGVPCIGRCEICGGPVLENEALTLDDEGVIWHSECDLNWM